MKKAIILLLIGIVAIPTYAQRRSSQKSFWSTHFMLSSSTFLSDLGGKNFYGSNDPSDIDLRDIRYALGTGLAYNTGKGLSFGLDVFYTRLTADDAETDWDRKYRKLHVRTDLIETAFKIEYTVPQNKGALRGFYANVGGGVAFFKPMAQWNGVWYKLRPLGTEGQNVDPNKEPYKKYSPVIPFGFGKKFMLRNGMMLAFDVSLRKTFTDYLDDVSTLYFDNNLIRATSGDAAAHLADPSGGEAGVGTPGEERGFSHNMDNYFLTGFKLTLPLGNSGYGRYNTSCAFGNSWIRGNGSLPKINRKGKRRRIRLFKK